MSERSEPTEILQAAALEAIKAMRAFLDIAETVVREPGTAAVVGKAFAEAAANVVRPSAAPAEDRDRDDDDGGEDEDEGSGRVRRIQLSD